MTRQTTSSSSRKSGKEYKNEVLHRLWNGSWMATAGWTRRRIYLHYMEHRNNQAKIKWQRHLAHREDEKEFNAHPERFIRDYFRK